MNKAQVREAQQARLYVAHGMHDTAARILSAMIRASLRKTATDELLQVARDLKIDNHPEFIV